MYGNHFTVFLLRCVNIYFITFKSIMHYSLFGGLAAHNHKFKTNFGEKQSKGVVFQSASAPNPVSKILVITNSPKLGGSNLHCNFTTMTYWADTTKLSAMANDRQ